MKKVQGVIIYISDAKKGHRVTGSTKELREKIANSPPKMRKVLEDVLDWNHKQGNFGVRAMIQSMRRTHEGKGS